MARDSAKGRETLARIRELADDYGTLTGASLLMFVKRPEAEPDKPGEPDFPASPADDAPQCSFCGRRQNEARRLVAGVAGQGAQICEECIELCACIVFDPVYGAAED